MGGILQFFDYNPYNTSRKLLAHKRHTDGLEAPRNSLEMPIEPSQSHHATYENIPFSSQVKQLSSKKCFCTNGTPMKKLMDQEISNGAHTKRSTPSVIARLMGMDSLPLEAKEILQSKANSSENHRNTIPRKKQTEISSTCQKPLGMAPLKQTTQASPPCDFNQDDYLYDKSRRFLKPQPREHPQEELLQKFKKEFKAWQAAKVWEHSRAVGLDNRFPHSNDSPTLAHENPTKERMTFNVSSKRTSAHKEPTGSMGNASTALLKVNPKGNDVHQLQSNPRGSTNPRNRTKTIEVEHFSNSKFDGRHDGSSSPTRIVILKPSSDDDFDESWAGSAERMQKEDTMENFLEEVKERLKYEIQGKSRNVTISRGSVTEASSNERPPNPKQIAQHIAKQIRESVTKDLGETLIRSESTRSYRSDGHFNGLPESINRNSRKLLSERLQNVPRNEDVDIFTITKGRSRVPVKERDKLRPTADLPKAGKKMNYWEDKKDVTEVKTRSFRHKAESLAEMNYGELSPRELIRSLSAPVSATAFGKLLLEDQHVLTAAHIRRKHEAVEGTSAELRRERKDGFNIKGRVSNLRYNLTLRGKLFGKRVLLAEQSSAIKSEPVKPIATPPPIVTNLGPVQENFTEVPPSPVSVSSSSQDDSSKPGHPSPVSPLEVPFIEDHSSLQVSVETNSNPFELASQLVEMVEEVLKENPLKAETAELVSHEEAYIRDIFLTAGLYDREPVRRMLSSWTAIKKPIPKWVFEEVEESCTKFAKVDHETCIDHKLLFDLVNETLREVLVHQRTSSTYRTLMAPGKKLVDEVWHLIKMHTLDPQYEFPSLDNMVARDLRRAPWTDSLKEDLDIIGELECLILEKLIDEVVLGSCS